MQKNKLLLTLIIVVITLNILDLLTALFILEGESNIIFLLTGSVWALIIGKILLAGVIIYVYKKNLYPSNIWYYSFISLLVLGALAFTVGIASNTYGIINPSVVQEASELTTTQKASYYSTIITIVFIIPYMLSILSFYFYNKTMHLARMVRK